MEALRKICIVLDCNIGDVVEFVPDDEGSSSNIRSMAERREQNA